MAGIRDIFSSTTSNNRFFKLYFKISKLGYQNLDKIFKDLIVSVISPKNLPKSIISDEALEKLNQN